MDKCAHSHLPKKHEQVGFGSTKSMTIVSFPVGNRFWVAISGHEYMLKPFAAPLHEVVIPAAESQSSIIHSPLR